MTNYTPGPWTAVKLIVVKMTMIHADPIATCWPAEGSEQANARLIAAAPELLEALREVVRISDRKHNAWDKAKAAIAKAEGRT